MGVTSHPSHPLESLLGKKLKQRLTFENTAETSEVCRRIHCDDVVRASCTLYTNALSGRAIRGAVQFRDARGT